MSRRPATRDLARIEEQLHRFATATFVCLLGAVLLCVFIVNSRGRLALALLQQLASLGVALWLAGFVLMFFAMYYRAQRRTALR